MPVRCVAFGVDDVGVFAGTAEVLASLADRFVLGVVTGGRSGTQVVAPDEPAHRFAFRLEAEAVGIARPDPRIFAMAAAAAGCHPAELVVVGVGPRLDVAAAQAIGAQGIWWNATGEARPTGFEPDDEIAALADLPAALARLDRRQAEAAATVGVGPHPEPWPEDARLDAELLADGDRRNVVDRYRYWSEAAIVDDLDAHRHPFHVAVENWRHDHNIGAVVRNANAFGAAGVHVIGRRRWNRRGAMATDRYLHVHHHDSYAAFGAWAAGEGLAVVAVDNVDGSVPLEQADLPAACVLVFGQEGPGLSAEARSGAALVCAITQYGSTRSLNAGVASGIAMYAWVRHHLAPTEDPRPR